MKDGLYPLSTICKSPILGKQHEETEVNDEVQNGQCFQEVDMTTLNERYTNLIA